MSQALITLFRTAFAAKASAKAPASTVRAISAVELRQVVGGTEASAPDRSW